MQQLKTIEASWDQEKKQQLVVLGQGPRDYNEILVYLENEIQNSKRMTNFNYEIPCFRNDGIYQLNRAIEHYIGSTSVKEERGMSSDGNMKTIDVELANGTRKKVPYGDIALPGMGEDAQIKIQYSHDIKALIVKGSCEFKYQSLIDQIIDMTINLLKTDSIYKSQAIEIHADHANGQPKVLNLDGITREVMILSEETEFALSPLYVRILQTEKCIKNNIPIKYGAILEGPYGTGKTLLAFKLAHKAIQNGWSFIYLKSPELLAQTLRMSKTLDKNGKGIIVFTEDIDQVTRGERDNALQDILNTLDGGDTKSMNVIALFTTNHLELIEPTFLRGKRIGSIISLGYLDAKTAKLYVKEFCGDIELVGDFTSIYQLIEESNIAPAFMAEIIENIKSIMIVREEKTITPENFRSCIHSYLKQMNLSKTKDTSVTKEMALASSLKQVLHDDNFYEDLTDSVANEIGRRYHGDN